MTAPESIINLVNKFHENEHQYTNPQIFDEENTKQEFITPFFEALGWDVYNNQGYSPQYKEVVMEDTIKVKDKHKSPDYSFRLGGQKVFLVEAKKPSRNIYEDKDHALQLRRYGWNAGLPLCILTDFQELAVYDTSIMPENNQGASIGRVKYYKYTDYITRWDEIRDIFSKDAVLCGKFDKYANDVNGGKHGTTRVDDKFLEEIEGWRLLLARNIALRNPELSIEELNLAVQLTIDRIIFLRIAEGRGIEREGRLQNLLKKNNIYKEFTKICREADQKYNSGLFHFTREENNDLTVDTYTLDLTIDDKVFREIFKNLYYPYSPYEFSMISTEILGKIYEQFLGKVIRLTPSHQAKVEDKPEVKKAGGVYYTPQYIVDYIVEHTLGEKIKGMTPNQISNVRVIDPACGSGSFLIRAYQYLLDYHLDYYSRLEKPPRDTVYVDKSGVTRLTINEKKRILKNNIYGVDLDTLAVEVTKLSLLLKVLEDQHKDQLEAQQKLFHERALPNLSSNIKNGNSLIGSDILEQQELSMEEIKAIKPFDYEDEFPEIFEQGGFDVIIGNPPYVRQESIKDDKPYYQTHYKSYTGLADIYVYFFEKGMKILKDEGLFGYICSNKWTKAGYGKKLRKQLLNYTITHYEDYTYKNVFENATVDVSTIIIKKQQPHSNKIYVDNSYFMKQEFLNQDSYIFMENYLFDLRNKLLTHPTIKEINSIFINRGVTTGLNDAFVIKAEEKETITKLNKSCKEIIKPVLRGKDINKYQITNSQLYLIYTPWDIKISKYPEIKEYLSNYKKELYNRVEVKRDKRYSWYCLSRYNANAKEEFEKNKIIWREISTEPSFTIDNENYYLLNNAYFMTSEINLNYLIAILNSNVAKWFFNINSINLGSKGRRYTRQYVEKLPIKLPETTEDEKLFDELINKILTSNKEISKKNTPTERKLLQKQIELTNKKINEKVYELYDLTEEEIRIVEESVVTEN